MLAALELEVELERLEVEKVEDEDGAVLEEMLRLPLEDEAAGMLLLEINGEELEGEELFVDPLLLELDNLLLVLLEDEEAAGTLLLIEEVTEEVENDCEVVEDCASTGTIVAAQKSKRLLNFMLKLLL